MTDPVEEPDATVDPTMSNDLSAKRKRQTRSVDSVLEGHTEGDLSNGHDNHEQQAIKDIWTVLKE